MLLNDKELRNILLLELNEIYKYDYNTKIINELGIDYGSSRVDIAVVNGIIHGYEIKSDVDTLNRLPRQISYYDKLFQRMTIVSTGKYYEQIMQMVPSWWGIKIVSKDNLRLITKRKGRYRNQQDKEILLKLLWKKDLEDLVDYVNLPKFYKKYRKNKLLNIFMQEVDLKTAQDFVYSTLKKRSNPNYNSSIVN